MTGLQGIPNTTPLPGKLPPKLDAFVADFRCFAQALLQRNFISKVVKHIVCPTQRADAQRNTIERFLRGFHLVSS